ncbi:MAG: Npun_F5749 family FMN-dependent PPOX-type flavoprotein [Cyanobacteria bacterium P01_H01_bin.121]
MDTSLAPWRSPLSRALHRNRSLAYSRYLQLATVDQAGHPANRTVVFRGFREGSNQLKFITDWRSQKIEQLAQQPWAEACWYFPKTREQFRLAGRITCVEAATTTPELQAVRRQQWQQLSANARSQFFWPPPGLPRNPGTQPTEVALVPDRELEPTGSPQVVEPSDPAVPPPTYSLLLLEPSKVDHLELRGTPQNRQQYHLETDGTWQKAELNP